MKTPKKKWIESNFGTQVKHEVQLELELGFKLLNYHLLISHSTA
jgi:hypothetical protein